MKFDLAFVLATLVPTLVSAHGYVGTITTNGKTYTGPAPEASSNNSPIRQITTIDPVKDIGGSTMSCGQNSPTAGAPQTLTVAAGSLLTFTWTDGPAHWPHNTGPVMNYMAACDNGDCSKFDGTKGKWFKVQQDGRKPNGDWLQVNLFNGGSVNATIPANIKPGLYMWRHEIIALHLAQSPQGAEFYPSCIQMNITGKGNAVPTKQDLLSFPGAYSWTDPGILVPNVYDPGSTYTFPGGPIASFIASNDPNVGSNPAATPSSHPSGPAASGSPSSSPANDSTKHKCHLKSQSSAQEAFVLTPNRRRRVRRRSARMWW